MSIFEFDEELFRKTEYNFAKNEGIETGINLVNTLLSTGRADDIPKIMQDPQYREKLLIEYNLL